jgi:hypothetical protein
MLLVAVDKAENSGLVWDADHHSASKARPAEHQSRPTSRSQRLADGRKTFSLNTRVIMHSDQ